MCEVLDDFLTYEWAGGGETRSGDFQIANFEPNGGSKAADVSRACMVSGAGLTARGRSEDPAANSNPAKAGHSGRKVSIRAPRSSALQPA